MRILVTTLALLCALTSAAHAQLQVFVWPAKFELAVPAGAADSRKIKVANTGNRPLRVHTYTSDWWYTPTAYKRFAPAGTFPRSSASWISVPTPTFELEVGEERLVDFTVSVPSDATGGHYGVLFFEVRPAPRKDENSLALRFGGRVGVLIAQFDPRTSKPRIQVKNTSVLPPSEVDPLTLTMTVHNPGNVHIVPQATATVISRATSKMVGKFSLESRPQYLPGQTGDLVGEWSHQLPPGEYDILTTISYFASKAIVERTVLTVPH